MTVRVPAPRRAALAKADSDHVRRQNRSLILAALRRRRTIARVDLGTETLLSPATITAITADLIAEGLVEAVADEATDGEGAEPARRGRPRVLLRLSADAAHVVAVKFAFDYLEIVAVDFSGAIIGRREPAIVTLEETAASFVARLAAEIRALVADCGLSLVQVAEITIGAQGMVDTNAGSVMWSPALRVRDMALVGPLTEALGRPCTLFNDANMIAQALHDANPDLYHGTFAVIFIDSGVGMGLFLGDRLHHGADGSAAEFGHMNHIPGGPLCRCGRRGCLEAYTANYAIFREARGLPPDTDPAAARPSEGDLIALEAAAYAGDARVRAIYAGVGEALGYGVARLMALVNPGRIVFTGRSVRAFALFEPALRRALGEALVPDLRRHTVLETLPWQDDMIMSGLVSYLLSRLDREVFANPAETRRYRR